MQQGLVVIITVIAISCGGFREWKMSATALQQSCQWETFQASCTSPDHVIVMQRAQYGRMRRGRCVKRDFGYIGCAANVLSLADQLCSGRTKCNVPVYGTFGHLRPCSELESYFEATFACVEVSFREIQCSSGDPPVPVTTSTSIASWNTGHSPGDATSRCSYQLHVLSGQHWKLTLLDFTNASPRKTDTKPSLDNEISAKRDVPTCMKYARIQEGNHTDFVVCGGHSRVRTVYLSQSNSVRVDFLADRWRTDSLEPKFIFRFEVVGCPDPTAASNVQWNRQGDDVIFQCRASGEKWRMRCYGGLWVGKHIECVTKPSDQLKNRRNDSQSIINDMVLVVMVGVSIGVTIGVTLLLVAAVSHKRRQFCATDQIPLSLLPVVTGRNLKLRAFCCSHASLVRASQLRDPTGASTLPSHVGHKRPIGSLPRGLWVAGGQEFEMASTLALSERILSSSSSSSSSSASSLVSSSCRSNIRVTQLCHEQGTPSHVYDVYESSLLGVGDENEIAGGGEKNVAEDGEMDGRE